RLYGKNPVLERLKANPKSISKILVQEGHIDAGYVRSKAVKWGIAVQAIPQSKMQKIARGINSQGILAEVEDFRYTDYEELLERVLSENISLVFLDGLMDPQNLGAIIRSLACLGAFAVVLPKKDSVDMTETVFRVASGGDNYVPVAKVSNLSHAISAAKKQGIFIAGAVTEEGEDLTEANFTFPLGLVVGSEQKGIRDIVKDQLHLKVTIPMAQPRLSFNAAQATTILCYEIARQKKKK
ncbi:MAG: 23S rRNA (guanosine(2251)-2'-O)-methyltransferase RlmB, partial [Candidatus Omnitrophica bacterium]|nr:23S rRNA (guanosine(2251)-2'-O)-methyltransferase RlmB [Candidatus Omnitrophota bacterium]